MKVALVHDYIKEYGGAERVLETLHEIFPDAPVYTLLYSPKYLGPHELKFKNWDIRASFLQYFPFSEKLISLFRIISPYVFSSMDLSSYDVIVVSQTGAYFPNLVKKGNAKLVCYCHTPPRYLYGYPTARKPSKWLLPFIHILNHILRMIDFKAAQQVDCFIANSKEVQKRIEKFYRKKSIVIYPPVDVARYKKPNSKSRKNNSPYYLCGGRLARAKRIDLAIKACLSLKVNLKIFGKSFAGYGEELKQLVSSSLSLDSKFNIEFLGEVTDEEKFLLMANAKAYIFPSEFEDFGITPVEAMGVGCPVIALKSGGVKETVIEGKTGLFFDEPTEESLVSALRKFDQYFCKKIKRKDCVKHANRFSKERFKSKISQIIDQTFRYSCL
ncbi:MAG: glycosyltransferase [Patescibacteria group bacterium]|nr:glycosyltransferase [Patescibacteria group bacterium]